MTTFATQIKSHGYWRVVIRPDRIDETRLANISEIFPLVQRLAVQLRGWDFPHIDPHRAPDIGDRWIGQDFEWEHHIERWRVFQSGQFAYLGGFTMDWAQNTHDWYPQPPKPPRDALMSVVDIAYRYAEIFEFASNLALSKAGDDPMFISIGCHGIAGRELWLDAPNRTPFLQPRKATIKEFVQANSFSRSELVADARAIGIRWAIELFRRFGWDISVDSASKLLN